MAPQRNRRPGFSRRAQYSLFLGYVIAGAGALLGAILLALSAINPPAYQHLRGGIREVTTPISSALDWVRRSVGNVPEAIGHYFFVMGENERLRAEVKATRPVLVQAQSINRENARLRALLRVQDVPVQGIVTARLVNSSASSTRRFATLNAGSRHGVRVGQPVRGPEGLIGRIVEVSPNTARVLLVIDTESIVPVRRARDGLPALAIGRGDGLIDIRSANVANIPLNSGDLFVTSGTGGLYPPNVPVARVMRNADDSSLSRPIASPDAFDFALVQNAFQPPPEPAAQAEPAPGIDAP